GVLAYAMAGVAVPVRTAAWRTAAAAFRPVAGISAAVVIVTGVIASVREVEHRYFLLWSAYGRFLLGKWALVAAMLVLGGLAGRALARGKGGAPPTTAAGAARGGRRVAGGAGRSKPVGSLLRTEAVLGVAVLIFAAT